MSPKLQRFRNRIIVAAVLFVVLYAIDLLGLFHTWFGDPTSLYVEFALFLVPYILAGYDVIAKAAVNLVHGHGLDENFLMTVATFGASGLVCIQKPGGNCEPSAFLYFRMHREVIITSRLIGRLFKD